MLVLHRRLGLEGLDYPRFRAALSAFVAVSAAWAAAAEAGFAMIPDPAPPAEPSPLDGRIDFNALA
jgi:hypothetical protein